MTTNQNSNSDEKIKKTGTSVKKTGTTAKKTGTTAKKTGTTAKKTGISVKKTGTTAKKTGTTAKKTGTSAKKTGTTAKKTGTTAKKAGTTAKKTGTTAKKTGTTAKKTETAAKKARETVAELTPEPIKALDASEKEFLSDQSSTPVEENSSFREEPLTQVQPVIRPQGQIQPLKMQQVLPQGQNTGTKIIIITGAIVIAILLFLVAILCVKVFSMSSDSVRYENDSDSTPFVNLSTQKGRENALKLAQNYLDGGMYDKAMDILNQLIIQEYSDKEARELLDKALELKKQDANQSISSDGLSLSFDTSDLSSAMQSTLDSFKDELARQNAENQRNAQATSNAINALVKQQQEQEESRKVREAEEKAQRKLEEEQRAKVEAERKRAEEEKAKKDATYALLLKNVNDEISKGKAALNAGDVEEALKHFENAKSLIPDEEKELASSKMNEIGYALYEASQNLQNPAKTQAGKAAVSYASGAIEASPNAKEDSSSHYILAMKSIEEKNYAQAEQELKNAVAKDTSNSMYYYQLGRAQANQKKYKEAAASFQTSVKYNDSYAPAQYNLGFVSERLNNQSQALQAYRKAYSVDPNYEKAYIAAARILVKQGDYNGGASAFNEAVRVNPSNAQTYQELGSCYSLSGKYTEAESSYKKALAYMTPGQEDPATYYNLSSVMIAQNKTEEALSYALKAYEKKNSASKNLKVNIIYNYALLCDQNGDDLNAITLYREVLQEEPSNIKAKTNLAVLCLEQNDADTAITLLSSAYTQDPKNFEVNNNLGNAYRMKENYNDAITYYQNALKIQNKNNTVRENLAKAYASAERYDSARATYEDVVKADNNAWEAWLELSKVCMQLKDNASAEKYLVYLQEKNPSFKAQEVASLLKAVSQ